MPNSLGNRALPELSEDERAQVLKFYRQFLRDIDRYQGHDESGKNIAKDKFVELCQSSSSQDCKSYRAYLRVHEEEVSVQAPKAAFAIISAFPILWKFDQSPVSSADLKKELTSSLATLKEWRAEVLDTNSPGKLFAAYPMVTNQFLLAHPSLCQEVERSTFDQQFLAQGQKYGRMGLELIATGATCALTEGIGCGLAGFGSAGVETDLSFKNLQVTTQRFSAEGDLVKSVKYRSNLVKSSDVENAQKDLLVGIAFGILTSAPVLHQIASATVSAPFGLATPADKAITMGSAVTFDGAEKYVGGAIRSAITQDLAAKVEEVGEYNLEDVGVLLFRDLSENLGR
jgi:hypothetical protein